MSAKYRKVYGGDEVNVTTRVKKDGLNFRDVPVEKKLTKEQLKHLHRCIRFTQQFKAAEAKLRAEEESEIAVDSMSLEQMRQQLKKRGEK